jgi:hypothetical protein
MTLLFGASFDRMPNLIDTYTLQFHGMERDELEYARNRFLRSARSRRRLLLRLWVRNRVVGLGVAVIAFGVLIGVGLAMVRALGNGFRTYVVGFALLMAVASLLSRAKALPAFADRWTREERDARDRYEMDRGSAAYAAQVLRERWPS